MEQLFAVKSVDVLMAEMAGEHRLRRVLGPVQLTALGVGCIIGAGIFVLTGLAANEYAGPALVLSFVVAGLGCTFAALCYAEFASMVPVAGSAYTYAYATLGELFAWIIGWDLVLEYAVARARWRTAGRTTSRRSSALRHHAAAALIASAVRLRSGARQWVATGALFNLPAVLVVLPSPCCW